jgi:hypothetical protein
VLSGLVVVVGARQPAEGLGWPATVVPGTAVLPGSTAPHGGHGPPHGGDGRPDGGTAGAALPAPGEDASSTQGR